MTSSHQQRCRLFGAVVFSPCMQSVLLIKPPTLPPPTEPPPLCQPLEKWNFPFGTSDDDAPLHHAAAAAHVLQATGLDITPYLTKHQCWIEAEVQGRPVKLFITVGVPQQLPTDDSRNGQPTWRWFPVSSLRAAASIPGAAVHINPLHQGRPFTQSDAGVAPAASAGPDAPPVAVQDVPPAAGHQTAMGHHAPHAEGQHQLHQEQQQRQLSQPQGSVPDTCRSAHQGTPGVQAYSSDSSAPRADEPGACQAGAEDSAGPRGGADGGDAAVAAVQALTLMRSEAAEAARPGSAPGRELGDSSKAGASMQARGAGGAGPPDRPVAPSAVGLHMGAESGSCVSSSCCSQEAVLAGCTSPGVPPGSHAGHPGHLLPAQKGAAPATSGAGGSGGGPEARPTQQTASAAQFELLQPFLPKLFAFMDRHPELRVPEPEPELVSLLAYNPSTWQGASPKEYLAQFCKENKLPAPSYSLVSRRSATRCYSTACCILPHLGVQVTPERHSSSREQAEQLAALCGILYLEGCLSVHTPHCRVVPVGFPPLLRADQTLDWEERSRQRSACMQPHKVSQAVPLDPKRQRLLSREEGSEATDAGAGPADSHAAQQEADQAMEDGDDCTAEVLHAGDVERVTAAGRLPEPRQQAGQHPGTRAFKRARVGRDGRASAGVRFSDGEEDADAGQQRPGEWAPGREHATTGATSTTATGSVGSTGGHRAHGQHTPSSSQQTHAPLPKCKVQELKEMCDRRRWAQPNYGYTRDPETGLYAATVSLPDAQSLACLQSLTSGPYPNKRGAKEAVAAKALARLTDAAAARSPVSQTAPQPHSQPATPATGGR